jgi:nitrogen-specific signal transduction histidine kinase/ActR/RegA family two-component response regulator
MNRVPDVLQNTQHLKRQIRQLESVAALSGGIAHDYNNLLTVIMGNISLALEHVEPDAAIATLLEQALTASRVAQTLTQRLITFSKGGNPSKTPTDIVQLVENTAAFSLSGSNIKCEFEQAGNIWSADVDPQQIGQAIHHLIINAAESMPSGGTISIRFENTTIDSPNSILAQGNYIDITIKDQGVGIFAEFIEDIFDPYFSTKGQGENNRGTGLGLSISHSIIAKHGGDITVCSRVGKGTTFHVLLPASTTKAQPVHPVIAPENRTISSKPASGHGRILVMDDEVMIRELTGNLLGHLGYDVDFAEEGRAAIDKYKAALDASAPYDAVILDLTIKGGMGGQETIKELKKLDPNVKAIVSSGYSDNPVVADYKNYGFCEVVAKPYEVVEFSRKLYQVVYSKTK